MDIEERARLAAALVPKPGLARYGAAAWVIGFAVFVAGALHVIGNQPHDPTPHIIATLLALIALGIVLIAFSLELLSQLRAHRAATQWVTSGNLERASAAHFALLERKWVLPPWRATFATSLATTTLMACHPERAIVLLRAVSASKTMPRPYESTLRDRTAITMLALGHVAAARALVEEESATSTWWARATHTGEEVKLLIDATVGRLGAASLAAERAEKRYELPSIGTRASQVHVRRAYGWLLIAYAWERVARARPAELRMDVEHRRDEAIARARDVPPHFYRYLNTVAPDFVAFADRFATG